VSDIHGIDDHDAIVLGSVVHNGAWLDPAVDLVRRHTAQLAVRPL